MTGESTSWRGGDASSKRTELGPCIRLLNGPPPPILRCRRARPALRIRPPPQAPRSQGPRLPRPSVLGRNIRAHCSRVRVSASSPPCIRSSGSSSESLYESADLSLDARRLAALLASKVYYYLEEYDEALSFALGAGSAFEQHSGTPGSEEYVETIVCE